MAEFICIKDHENIIIFNIIMFFEYVQSSTRVLLNNQLSPLFDKDLSLITRKPNLVLCTPDKCSL